MVLGAESAGSFETKGIVLDAGKALIEKPAWLVLVEEVASKILDKDIANGLAVMEGLAVEAVVEPI